VKQNLYIFQDRRKSESAIPKGRTDERETLETQIPGAAGEIAASAVSYGKAAHGRENPRFVPHG